MGLKRFETRSWQTNYRGPLLICAARRCGDLVTLREITVNLAGIKKTPFIVPREMLEYPRGVALCVVDLREIFRTDDPQLQYFCDEQEQILGDFSPGRFAWELTNVRRFKEPWPVTGRQGLFNVPDEMTRLNVIVLDGSLSARKTLKSAHDS